MAETRTTGTTIFDLSTAVDEATIHAEELAGLYVLFKEAFLETDKGTVWEYQYGQMEVMEGLLSRMIFTLRDELATLRETAEDLLSSSKTADSNAAPSNE